VHVRFAVGDEYRRSAAGALRAGSVALDEEQSLSKEQETGSANEDLILEKRCIDAGKDECDAVTVIPEPADPLSRLATVWRIEPDAPAPGFHETTVKNRPHGVGCSVLLFSRSARIQIEAAECFQNVRGRLPVVRGLLPATLMLDIGPVKVGQL